MNWLHKLSFQRRVKKKKKKIAYEQSQKSIRQEAPIEDYVNPTMDGLWRTGSLFSSRDNPERNERSKSEQHLIFLHNTNTWSAIQDTRIMKIINKWLNDGGKILLTSNI